MKPLYVVSSLTVVERAVQSDGDQRFGPHAVSRVHQELAADSSNAITDKVRSKCDQDLVRELSGIRLVEKLGEVLRPN